MTPEQYQLARALFHETFELDAEARVAVLAARCHDAAVRAEVERLLASAAVDGAGILDRPVAGNRTLPAQVGRYRILRLISEGGMGAVYEAEQDEPKRRVALKVIRSGMVTRPLLRRFRSEASALARLRHPGIAHIYEAGTADTGEGGQPYFAMEMVSGPPLDAHVAARKIDFRGRLELIARIADAVHHAHLRGIIHRDLKPANILVVEDENRRSAVHAGDPHGQPKILDFGVARLTESDMQTVTLQTDAGQLVGTVPYMSPEQAAGDPEQIDPRSDVYTIGVIAYELLAGKLPYPAQGRMIHEAVRVIRETEPARLGSIDGVYRGDVDTIVAKALEKDPDRRYASAAQLAADIRRFLADEPILARPASALYQLRKFTRRNRALVAGVVTTLVVAVVGAAVSARYAVIAGRRAATLERASYIAGLAAAVSALEGDDYHSAAAYLDRTPVKHRGWEYDHLRARLVQHLAEFDLPLPLVAAPAPGPSGDRVHGVMADGSIGTWDIAGGSLIERTAPLACDLDRPFALHGPTGRYAATARNGDVVVGALAGRALIEIIPCPDEPGVVHGWDATGERVLYESGGTRVWDGRRSRLVTGMSFAEAHLGPSGDRIVGLQGDDRLSIVDAATGQVRHRRELADYVSDMRFSPDGETIAVAGVYRNVYLLDGRTLKERARLIGHEGLVHGIAWSADGRRLVTTSVDGTARIWDVAGAASLAVLATGGDQVRFACVASDGRRLVIGGDRLLRFRMDDPNVLRGHESFVYFLAFSPDGSLLASSAHRGESIFIWDVARRRKLHRLPAPATGRVYSSELQAIPAIAFSADGSRLVAGSARETLQWNAITGEALPVPPAARGAEGFLRTLGHRRNVRVTIHTYFGPGGRESGLLNSPDVPATEVSYTVISPDGMKVAMCRKDGRVMVYDRASSERAGTLVGHVGIAYCAAFSPDGTRIATGGNDMTVRIWDASTCEQLLILRGHDQYVKDVMFSPDGTLLVSASGDFTVRLWDTKPLHVRRAGRSAASSPGVAQHTHAKRTFHDDDDC